VSPASFLEINTEKDAIKIRATRMAQDKIPDPENACVANSAVILTLERGSSEDRVTWI